VTDTSWRTQLSMWSTGTSGSMSTAAGDRGPPQNASSRSLRPVMPVSPWPVSPWPAPPQRAPRARQLSTRRSPPGCRHRCRARSARA
jgi:hypothetical protein